MDLLIRVKVVYTIMNVSGPVMSEDTVFVISCRSWETDTVFRIYRYYRILRSDVLLDCSAYLRCDRSIQIGRIFLMVSDSISRFLSEDSYLHVVIFHQRVIFVVERNLIEIDRELLVDISTFVLYIFKFIKIYMYISTSRSKEVLIVYLW